MTSPLRRLPSVGVEGGGGLAHARSFVYRTNAIVSLHWYRVAEAGTHKSCLVDSILSDSHVRVARRPPGSVLLSSNGVINLWNYSDVTDVRRADTLYGLGYSNKSLMYSCEYQIQRRQSESFRCYPLRKLNIIFILVQTTLYGSNLVCARPNARCINDQRLAKSRLLEHSETTEWTDNCSQGSPAGEHNSLLFYITYSCSVEGEGLIYLFIIYFSLIFIKFGPIVADGRD